MYRRWPTKAALVAAAVADRSEQLVPVPDTGSLVGDLTALGRSIADNLSSELGSALARTIIAAASVSAEVAEVNREFWTVRLALTETIVDRAVDRGEVSADVSRRVVIETLIGPIYVRLLLTGEPFDAPFVADVAAMVAVKGRAHRPCDSDGVLELARRRGTRARPGSRSLKRRSCPSARSWMVHYRVELICVTGRQPSTICATPPEIFNT